jgi:pyoluteorin transport system ATP-binding protein
MSPQALHNTANSPLLVARDVSKTFHTPAGEHTKALDRVSFEVRRGKLTALVGPDGAGKTTLLRLATGLHRADAGELRVLGIDVAQDPAQVQARIAYMPQRFGLYEDLSVQENLDLYADLHGVSESDKFERYPQLLRMTALADFTGRLAGQLSGGMKQKLGLACTLVRAPELLLLDEPTVGVDPLSRRELWGIIAELVKQHGVTVLLCTSYLDEAERCDHAVVLNQGRVLAHGPPSEVRDLASARTFIAEPAPGQTARGLQAQLLDSPKVLDAVPEGGRVRFIRMQGAPEGSPGAAAAPQISALSGVNIWPGQARFEDGFMVLLREASPDATIGQAIVLDTKLDQGSDKVVVQVRGLVRKFGGFTAVDHVDFEVRGGQIFGLLGPNGAGKTTTFRMLCGLLPATSGTLRVAGMDLRTARASARQRIGYVAQKFSLYGQLTVAENLEFFASAYSLRGDRKRARIDWALQQFELIAYAQTATEQLPGGFKRRLAMAAALLHEPETLFLDEPTSGADPLARREFWRRITRLAEQGVTVVVTTHFMEEAEYCDQVAILDEGKVLAQGTPAEIRQRGQTSGDADSSMEQAFIRIVEKGREAQNAARPRSEAAA